jgi:hypothetical protein
VIGYYDDDEVSGKRKWVEIDKKDCKTIVKDSLVNGYKIYIEDIDDVNDNILEAFYIPDIFVNDEITQLIDSLIPIKFINFDDY